MLEGYGGVRGFGQGLLTELDHLEVVPAFKAFVQSQETMLEKSLLCESVVSVGVNRRKFHVQMCRKPIR